MDGIKIMKNIWVVINKNGTYSGMPCKSEEEAKELASQEEGRIIYKAEVKL